jgi:hypothetical protein
LSASVLGIGKRGAARTGRTNFLVSVDPIPFNCAVVDSLRRELCALCRGNALAFQKKAVPRFPDPSQQRPALTRITGTSRRRRVMNLKRLLTFMMSPPYAAFIPRTQLSRTQVLPLCSSRLALHCTMVGRLKLVLLLPALLRLV